MADELWVRRLVYRAILCRIGIHRFVKHFNAYDGSHANAERQNSCWYCMRKVRREP